jgi:hypothetical protein
VWRTNVALGATRLPVDPPAVAVELALAAARSVGGALVGVDLLPTSDGGPTILEVNGSVEFTHDYLVGRDVFRAVVLELARVALEAATRDRPTGADPVLALPGSAIAWKEPCYTPARHGGVAQLVRAAES